MRVKEFLTDDEGNCAVEAMMAVEESKLCRFQLLIIVGLIFQVAIKNMSASIAPGLTFPFG